jgi:hypothetical protein
MAVNLPPPRFEIPQFNPRPAFPHHELPGINFPKPGVVNRPGFPPPHPELGLPGRQIGPRVIVVGEPPPIPRPVVRVPAEAPAPRPVEGALEDTLHLANKGDWKALSHQLDTLGDLRVPPQVEGTLTSLKGSSRTLEKLDSLDGLVAGNNPAAWSKATKLVEGPNFAALRDPVRDLASLEALQASLKASWKQAPKLADVDNGLAAYGRVTGDPAKVAELRWKLACEASGQGHRDLALGLVPNGRNPADLPPVRPLIPEAAPGTRPAVRESALAGLSEPENEVATAVAVSRRQVSEAVKTARTQHTAQVNQHLNTLTNHLHRKDREREEKRLPADPVAQALGRPLTASERILAQAMAGRGQGPAQIAATLRDLEAKK